VKRRALLRVGKNAAALLVARGGLLLAGLWLNGQLTRSLGVAGLGRYLLALTVEGIALALVNLGLNVYALRELARCEDEAAEALLGTVLMLKGLAALAAMAILNGVLIPLLFAGPRRAAVTWASMSLLPQAVNGGLTALLNGRERMELSSFIDVASRLAGAIGGVVWLAHSGDERHVLACYLLGHILATVALARVLVSWRMFPRIRGWRERAGDVLRESLPFAGVDVIAMLYRRVDLLLLGHWYVDAVVGIYGAAYRLSETLGMVPGSLLDALFPILAKEGISGEGRGRLVGLYRRGALLLLALVLVIGGSCLLFAPQMMTFAFGRGAGLDVAIRLFRVLLLTLPFRFLYLLNGHLLYAVGEQRRVFVRMALATAANVLINVALIPSLGVWGATVAIVVAEGMLFILLSSAARRQGLHRVVAVEATA
jgi:O-antigen/teichoic acid export membrane protein